jgi:hypothetical protein
VFEHTFEHLEHYTASPAVRQPSRRRGRVRRPPARHAPRREHSAHPRHGSTGVRRVTEVLAAAQSDPIRTLVDTWLARHPQVWAAAGHPHTVFSTTYAELLELTGGRAVDVER